MNFLTQALNSAFDRTSAALQKYLKIEICKTLSSGSKMKTKDKKFMLRNILLLCLSQFISIFIIPNVRLKDDLGTTTLPQQNSL